MSEFQRFMVRRDVVSKLYNVTTLLTKESQWFERYLTEDEYKRYKEATCMLQHLAGDMYEKDYLTYQRYDSLVEAHSGQKKEENE